MAVDDPANNNFSAIGRGVPPSTTESSTPHPHSHQPPGSDAAQEQPPPPTGGSDVTVSLATPADADNALLVQRLTDIVNAVYAETEADIWGPGFQRTSTAKVADLIRGGEVAVAYRHDHPVQQQQQQSDLATSTQSPNSKEPIAIILGCVQITQHGPKLFEFGMLAVDPAIRGAGIGRQLVHFAESHARRLGIPSRKGNGLRNSSSSFRMQLHLLVPASDPEHAFKMRLRQWYERMGYAEGAQGGGDFAAAFPALAPLLAGPVVYHCLEKELF